MNKSLHESSHGGNEDDLSRFFKKKDLNKSGSSSDLNSSMIKNFEANMKL